LYGRFKDGFSAVADPSDCVVVSPHAKEIRNFMQRHIEDSPFPPYEKTKHVGFWRQITVKTFSTGQAMLIIQVDPTNLSLEEMESEKQKLIQYFDTAKANGLNITSVLIQGYNGVSNAAPIDLPCAKLWGDEYVHETLLKLRFRISANAFFQVNTSATEVMYKLICDWCEPTPNATILDICCGTGTIGQSIAKIVPQIRVVGFELSDEAVNDARVNAVLNGLQNVMYILGKVEDKLPDLLKTLPPGPVIGIVDPPRAGLHPIVIRAIRNFDSIKRLIYVSCDQTILIRDAAVFCKSPSKTVPGIPFKPIKSIAVDMFPHTDRVEMLVVFERDDEFVDNRQNQRENIKNNHELCTKEKDKMEEGERREK
jgi:tRNA (uracil-5-)-methyltransferase